MLVVNMFFWSLPVILVMSHDLLWHRHRPSKHLVWNPEFESCIVHMQNEAFWQQNHKELCSSAGLSVLIARHALPNKTMQNNEAKSYWLSVIVFNVLPLLQPGSTGSSMIPQKRSKQLPVSKGHSHRCYPTMFLTDSLAISRILMFNTWT